MIEIVAQQVQQLIPLWTIRVESGTELSVNARDLHAFLEVQSKFADWIKRRLEEYGLEEGIDFSVFLNSENNSEGRPRTDYYLTLDAGKELAMVEKTEKGKAARRYFLDCERQAKAAAEQKHKSMTTAELILAQAQQMVEIEREQVRQEKVQRQLEQRQAAVEARTEANERQLQQLETATDHFTIIGWYRYAKQAGSLPIAEAARMGKLASQFCKEHDVAMGRTPDPRFGTVKTYPKWVLDELFVGPAN